ncbi:MAG: discoidin domain-containing protein [Anaerolineae bacterium]|nr:discoidin domain-containing protein [Anaerolineae bacterium]
MRRVGFLAIILLLLINVVPSFAQGGVSGQSNVADDTFVITCDTGEEIIGGVKFTFLNINPGFNYRVTAIGIDDFDPSLAVVTAPGEGRCNDDEVRAATSEVAVPGFGLLTATNRTAQVTVNTPRAGNVDVIVGGYQGATGQFAMVIEGLAINPRTELDGFLISVPSVVQDQEIGVYMVSRYTNLDSYMMLWTGEGLQQDPINFDTVTAILDCDDVAVGNCASVPAFPGGGVSITNGNTYVAGATDAGIIMTPNSNEKFLFAFGSSNEGSTGDYAIIVTGTVPGSLTETTTSTTTTNTGTTANCNNVISSVDASSQYDDTYGPENLLDNNPNTSWSSSTMEGEQYIIVLFDQPYSVDRILFNTHSASPGFEKDSIKDFELVVISQNNKLTTIFVGEAQLQQGYQEFTFPAVTTDRIGINILSNHGGTTYEAADLIVCGQ